MADERDILANLVSRPGGDIRSAMFIGPKGAARLGDSFMDALAKAKEAWGYFDADKEAIRKDTGWFNQHGDWKMEIPDNEAGFTDDTIEKMLKAKEGVSGYIGPDRQPDLFTGQEGQGLVKHPSLFKAYPELENTKLKANLTYGQMGGSFLPGEIDVTARHTSEARDVLMHELQHAVQREEGFPVGGNTRDKTLAAPMAKVKTKAERMVGDLYDQQRAFQDQRIAAGDPRNYTNLAKVWKTGNPEKARELDAAITTSTQPGGMQAGYHHLAGETEARNAARRRDFNAEALQDLSPYETQDLPDSLQIVRRRPGRNSLAAAMTGAGVGAASAEEGESWSPGDQEKPWAQPGTGPAMVPRAGQMTASAWEPSLRDELHFLLTDKLGLGQQQASNVAGGWGSEVPFEMGLADLFTPTGAPLALNEAQRSWDQGDYLGTALNAAGVIPGLAAGKALRRGAKGAL